MHLCTIVGHAEENCLPVSLQLLARSLGSRLGPGQSSDKRMLDMSGCGGSVTMRQLALAETGFGSGLAKDLPA